MRNGGFATSVPRAVEVATVEVELLLPQAASNARAAPSASRMEGVFMPAC